MHHSSIDAYASLRGPVHRLDARSKLLAALGYTALCVSEPRAELAGLFPYLVGPVVVILVSGVPLGFVLKRMLVVSPLALAVAALNPIYETGPVTVSAWGWSATVRGGWVTGAAMVVKFLVGALSVLALATTTRLARLTGAMASLGVPRLVALQVGLLYRYLFVIVDEHERRSRAAEARSVGRLTLGSRVRAAGSGLGGLFARSIERAERVGAAMALRGFDGTAPRAPGSGVGVRDVAFLTMALALGAGLRFRDHLSGLISSAWTGG